MCFSHRPQDRECCQRSARDYSTIECNECGQPLLRCSNHSSCNGLLNSENVCPICFAPELKLIADNESVTVGQAAQIKMELANRSPSSAKLLVQQVWIRIGNNDWSPVDLPWDHVASRQAKPIRFTTQPLKTGGELGGEIVLVLGTQSGFRKEAFAFSANFTLSVDDRKDVVVQQNIHYAAKVPQNGATIYAPVRVESERKSSELGGEDVTVLELHRAPRHEHFFGVRSTDKPHVGPLTRIEYVSNESNWSIRNFAQRRSQLVFGRSRTWAQGGTNDVRLLFSGPEGDVDEAASLQISREHFCIFLEQGQLKIRSLSSRGIHVDGGAIFPGDVECLSDGSKIELVANSARVSVRVKFVGFGNEVSSVVLRQD